MSESDTDMGRWVETRKRGFFGKIFKIMFILFNMLMVVWIFSYWIHVGHMINDAKNVVGMDNEDAYKTGAGVGTLIGTTALMMFWALGDIILGMATFFSRGKKVITRVKG